MTTPYLPTLLNRTSIKKKVRKQNFFRQVDRYFAKANPTALFRKVLNRSPSSTSYSSQVALFGVLLPSVSKSTRASLALKYGKFLLNLSNASTVSATRALRHKFTKIGSPINLLDARSAPSPLPTRASSLPSLFYNLSLPYTTLRSRYKKFPRSLSPRTLRAHKTTSRALLPYFSNADPLTRLFSWKWLTKWFQLTSLYSRFYSTPQLQLYLIARKSHKKSAEHLVRFKFNQNRLALSLADKPTNRTHFFLSPGLLLKHFNHKKSLKKSKSMRMLMMRFLRKLIILVKLKNVTIHVKGVPLFLPTLLNMLFKPLPHLIVDPFVGKIVNEAQLKRRNLRISGLTFVSPKPFGYQKDKKIGRLKRKVRRKVMKANKVLDEK